MKKEKFVSIHIDREKEIYEINGEEKRNVSHLELEFKNGEWSLMITEDVFYNTSDRNI